MDENKLMMIQVPCTCSLFMEAVVFFLVREIYEYTIYERKLTKPVVTQIYNQNNAELYQKNPNAKIPVSHKCLTMIFAC